MRNLICYYLTSKLNLLGWGGGVSKKGMYFYSDSFIWQYRSL